MYSTSQLFLSVVILVIKTKSAIALQHVLPHATLQTISEGLYPADFVGLEENTAWYHIQQSFSKTSTNLMKGSPLENNIMAASSESSSLIYTDSCWPNSAEQSKIQTLQKITFLSHYCNTWRYNWMCLFVWKLLCHKSSLLKIEDIQPRSKIGQNLCQQAADQRE